jgi:hypothetical protein
MLYRCFAWNEGAHPSAPDGPLWFPRIYQGEGRHDNPDAYGCLYLADRAQSCIVEQLARFRTQRLTTSLLRRRGLPLAIAELELEAGAAIIDLDQPRVLAREKLRPSIVATRHRLVTQPQALAIYNQHRRVVGLRWWSTYESTWANVTLFDRAAGRLRVIAVHTLNLADPALVEAAQFFAMQLGPAKNEERRTKN